MNNISRRRFLKQTALATAVASWSARSWAQVAGANNDIRVAVVGFNGRGKDHIAAWSKMPGVRLTALCDVDGDVLNQGVESCKAKGLEAEGFADIRKLLDSKNVDAISIATPNHWHALAGIWGMQSGKDVYVEKPVSFDIWEGQQLVAAAKQYNRIVQAGTQSRSSTGIREAVAWVGQGNIGKIRVARGICYKRRPSIGLTEGLPPIPSSVNYDLWTGPAPVIQPHRKKFHYDWHWFWNYGAGDLGNQGVHEIDVARWFLGEENVPFRTIAMGGRLGYVDDAQTPNSLVSFYDYAAAPLIMEVRGLPEKSGSSQMDKYKGVSIGVVVECEGGYVTVPNYNSAKVFDKTGKEIKSFQGSESHFENFIKAVRSRNPKQLHAPILTGHRSTALCHLGNISYRLGQWQSPDEIRAAIKADGEASASFDRMVEHLGANEVDLAKTMPTLGAVIKINPQTEQIIENKKANAMLKRIPRHGYTFKVA